MKVKNFSLGIRGRLLWMFAFLIIVPVTVLGILSYSKTQILEVSVLLGTKQSLSEQSSELAQKFNQFEQKLLQVSQTPDVRIDKVQPGIVWNKYENLPKVNRPELTQLYSDYFSRLVKENGYFHQGFIATANGAYYVGPIYPNEDLSEYDPSIKGWFKDATAKPDQIVWSEPEFDSANGSNYITVAKAVVDEQGKVVGVVGFDVDLKTLSTTSRQDIAWSTIWIGLISIIIGLGIAYWFSSRVTRNIYQVKAGIEQVAAGDYNAKLNISGNHELSELAASFNQMTGEIRQLLSHFGGAVEQVHTSSDQVSAQTTLSLQQLQEGARAIDEIAIGATKQAEEIEQSSRFIMQVSSMITQMAQNIEEMNKLSRQTYEASQTGLTQMDQMEQSVKTSEQMVCQVVEDTQQLHEKSKRVGDIISLINSIANQTNLLALNAAIEAARAGEHGRGFAVVADEVRKLAEQSAHSTQEITKLLDVITENIDHAVGTMNELQATIQDQTVSFDRVNRQFHLIAGSINTMESKADGLTESVQAIEHNQSLLTANMSSVASVSEETAASAEEVAATTEESYKSFAQLEDAAQRLRGAAGNLEQQLEKFNV
ncbi:methyl-accepting chemotaxis protein [Brevibacillus ginsengisoli]|uniref:methyl-accepting chemotaxis protein n=1 Tax=Brevibacillus ginsengisoli TaxID=363854 RepID=UPI003CFA02B0